MKTVDLIVTRHPGAVEWLSSRVRCALAPVASATAEQVRGKIVAGVLPLYLADAAARVLSIDFAGDPPRGAEYTAEDMDRAGARLVEYTVVSSQTIPAGDLDAVETAKITRDREAVYREREYGI